MTTITKIWNTPTDINHNTTEEYQNYRDAHSRVLFSILRALKDNAVVEVLTQEEPLKAHLKIYYTEKNTTCEIYLESM